MAREWIVPARPWPIPGGLEFASDRIRLEWLRGDLASVLWEPILWLIDHRRLQLGLGTLVTCLWRSDEENAALGAKSLTHVEWRAIDLRVSDTYLEAEDLFRLELNRRFPTGGRMVRCPPLRHGTAPHYHLQASRAEAALDD